jgi:hypothetical protein
VTNTASGVIEAVPGSTVDLGLTQPIVIIGGTLKADSGSLFSFESGGTFTLDGSSNVVPTNKMLTISGEVSMRSGCSVTLEGTINNAREILLDNSADALMH